MLDLIDSIPRVTQPEAVPSGSDTVRVRYAAKLAIRYPDGSYLLVRGDRPFEEGGMLNLLGGGINPGETPQQARDREKIEESNYMPIEHDEPRYIGKVSGEVTNREGETLVATWMAYVALGIQRPTTQEIQKYNPGTIFILSRDELNGDMPVSDLAIETIDRAESLLRR